ncbi:GntG family PLP-dependent aldolase [Pelagibius sp. CAU 1746]|uniref:threonine aldolase family protein n=1 Tax=Pelagibius sp. CAU 1746 TaxID=3140370 RepID=UPI00325BA2AE
MAEKLINLYSDTQTQPSKAMRLAMAEAEVGDEQRGEDPSVNRLCEMTAELLGKEAAVFLPSGTMCNQLAIHIHCRPGEEIIAHRSAHILNAEGGGTAAFSGAQVQGLDGPGGLFSVEAARAAIRPKSRYNPQTRLIAVEQTANFGGGTIWPLSDIEALGALAQQQGLAYHMDGARLLNAVVAAGVSAKDFSAPFDSVWIDLSKGLGCPVGAVLAGSSEFIEEVWRLKQRTGGAMRQAGIIAAAGIYALEHNVERLAEDHDNAKLFAESLRNLPGIWVDVDAVETNIVFFDIAGTGLSAETFCAALKEKGVDLGGAGARIRAVTHLDISRADVEAAITAIREVLSDAKA